MDDGWKVRTFHLAAAVGMHADTVLGIEGALDPETVSTAEHALGGQVRVVPLPPVPGYSLWRVLAGLLTPLPVHYWNQRSAAVRAVVRGLAGQRKVEIAIAVTTFMYQHIEPLDSRVLRVIDTHNLDSITLSRYAQSMPSFLKRWYARATAKRMRHLERISFSSADLVWVCSKNELEAATRAIPGARIEVIPNGVDCAWFQPREVVGGKEKSDLLFFGKLDYFPNVDALEYFISSILPRIRRAANNAELRIVGPDPCSKVRKLGSQPGVLLIGPVPDIREALSEADIVVVPLRAGGGTRLKILEALAMGKPVVTTSVGAEGLSLLSGRDLLIADDPAGFAAAVVGLLRDPAGARRMGLQGRETVRTQFDWASIGELAWESLVRCYQEKAAQWAGA